MERVTHNEKSNVLSEYGDQFPKGVRVLVVDDDVTCLLILEKMLQDCSYQVTKCQRGEEALSMIRENKGGFDIVLTDVHMPGMDGLQLLAEIANTGVTLPVVMFSSDSKKDTVLKGVNSGACDFLVKPIQINTLKILWRHMLRSNQSPSKNSTKELETLHNPTTSSSNNTHTRAENEEENSKSSKRSSEEEADHGQSKSRAKKPRLVWTPELNQMFITAVNSLGKDDVKPNKILQIMRKMTGVPPHLTRQNVSSHLQKYCMNSKKTGDALKHQSTHSSLINSPGFANLTHSTPPSLSLIGSSGIQNCTTSAQYPSRAMAIAPGRQCTCCSMRMPKLVEFPDHNASLMYQTGLQPQPLVPLQQPNPLLQNHSCQQQANESAQCPSYAPTPFVGFTSPMNAAAGHYLSATTNPHPLHSQIPTHDIQSLNSSAPHLASERGLPVALSTIGAKANESCGTNILAAEGEFYCGNDHNQVAEDCQVYTEEAMFADILDLDIFEDLGFGEGIPFLDSYIQDNGTM
ncbi:hypothetical protein ACJRO7_029531 [Eucalyptus globulus]|uniref:Response regulatory domain-containing protein n=1 Tax=Eucalyptus globulus TaxID=34317 RepID=A0ABD3JAK4_EUCGL